MVIGEESEGLVKTTIFVGARVLGRDQIEVGHLKLVEGAFIAHLRKELLQVLRFVILDLNREKFAL